MTTPTMPVFNRTGKYGGKHNSRQRRGSKNRRRYKPVAFGNRCSNVSRCVGWYSDYGKKENGKIIEYIF